MAQRGELVLSGRLVPSERRQDDDDSRRRKRRRLAFYDDNEEKRMKGERKRMRELLSLLVTQWVYIHELLGDCPDVKMLIIEHLAFFGLYRCCRLYQSTMAVHCRRDPFYLLPIAVDLEEFSLKIVACLDEHDRYYSLELIVERVSELFGNGTGLQLVPLTDPMRQIGCVPFNAHQPTSIYVAYEMIAD